MSDARIEAERQINDADISAGVYRTATRLLQQAAVHGGTVVLTKPEMMTACGTDTESTMRAHLWHLSRSKIVHFSTNGLVYVTFLAYVTRVQRALPLSDADYPNREPSAGDDDRAHSARNISQDARNISQDARNIGFLAGGKGLGWVELNSNADHDQLDPQPNPPTPQTEEPPNLTCLKPDQVWAYRLLTDPEIDMIPTNAFAAAKLHTALWVVKQVAAWSEERDRAGKDSTTEPVGVGLLVWRLLSPDSKFRPGQPQAEFLASDFYRRHYATLEVLEDPPEWFWELPRPPREERVMINGEWTTWRN